jgi:hypothetical protein
MRPLIKIVSARTVRQQLGYLDVQAIGLMAGRFVVNVPTIDEGDRGFECLELSNLCLAFVARVLDYDVSYLDRAAREQSPSIVRASTPVRKIKGRLILTSVCARASLLQHRWLLVALLASHRLGA